MVVKEKKKEEDFYKNLNDERFDHSSIEQKSVRGWDINWMVIH